MRVTEKSSTVQHRIKCSSPLNYPLTGSVDLHLTVVHNVILSPVVRTEFNLEDL